MTRGHGSESVKVLALAGAGLKPSCLEPFTKYLENEYGYRSVAVNLHAADTSATFADDAVCLYEAAGDSQAVYIVAESRGGEAAIRAPHEFEVRGESERLIGITLDNFPGPHGLLLPGETEKEAKKNRHTEQFEEARPKISDSLTEYRPEMVAEIFGIKDPEKLQILLGSLSIQRTAEASAAPLEPLPEGLPVFTIQGKDDQVLNIEHAVRLHLQWLRKSPRMEPGGHLLLLEKPIRMARIVSEHIARARSRQLA
jgi:pimeloyl-ACP methyl ester carboxylesterase